jgi:hypothetical protein
VPGCLIDSERSERLRYFGFAGFVGLLLLLNLTGYFKTVFGIDPAAIVTVRAGYRIFFNSIEALLDREISADLAICISVIAALAVGQYLAAAKPCSSCGGGKAGGVRGRPDPSGHPSLCRTDATAGARVAQWRGVGTRRRIAGGRLCDRGAGR